MVYLKRRPGTHVRVLANELVRNIYLFERVAVGDRFISSCEYKVENARTYRTLEVAVRKSLPGSSPPLSGHGTYIDL